MSPVPKDCPILDPDQTQEIRYVNQDHFDQLAHRMKVSDWIKIGVILFAIIAGWLRMEAKTDNHETRLNDQAAAIKNERDERKQDRRDIEHNFELVNQKLDRLIERRER